MGVWFSVSAHATYAGNTPERLDRRLGAEDWCIADAMAIGRSHHIFSSHFVSIRLDNSQENGAEIY